MTARELQEAYDAAWRSYYAPQHLETIMRRARAAGILEYGLMLLMLWFIVVTFSVEKIHPMQGGVLRLRHRSERRPGLPAERLLGFYARFACETGLKHFRLGREMARILGIAARVALAGRRSAYTDRALASVDGDEAERALLLTRGAPVG